MPVHTVLRQYAPGPGREVTARGGTGRHLPPPRRPLPRVATQGIMSKGARRGGWHPLGCPGGAGLDECRRTRAAASPPPAAAAGGHTTAARRRPSLGCPAAERLERVEPGQLALPRAGPEHMKALRGEYCRGGPVLPEPRCAPGLRGRRQAAHRWRSTDACPRNVHRQVEARRTPPATDTKRHTAGHLPRGGQARPRGHSRRAWHNAGQLGAGERILWHATEAGRATTFAQPAAQEAPSRGATGVPRTPSVMPHPVGLCAPFLALHGTPVALRYVDGPHGGRPHAMRPVKQRARKWGGWHKLREVWMTRRNRKERAPR